MSTLITSKQNENPQTDKAVIFVWYNIIYIYILIYMYIYIYNRLCDYFMYVEMCVCLGLGFTVLMWDTSKISVQKWSTSISCFFVLGAFRASCWCTRTWLRPRQSGHDVICPSDIINYLSATLLDTDLSDVYFFFFFSFSGWAAVWKLVEWWRRCVKKKIFLIIYIYIIIIHVF